MIGARYDRDISRGGMPEDGTIAQEVEIHIGHSG